ncbi:uncharacterized protein LOC134828053 [Culicoides brevitarsis]|uniref:uncharacterized protein LOC134828053 n=1 Tax=Culicoides brevitarsis TaxID=469753 RepID=UPI00307C2C9C
MFHSCLSPTLMEPPDVVLNIGSMNFLGHSYLLSSFSEVLKAACEDHGTKDSGRKKIIQLHNISPNFMNHVLYYIYTGQLNLNEDNVFGILLASHSLQIPKLAQICNEYLLKNRLNQYKAKHNVNVIRPIANKPKPVNVTTEGPVTNKVWLPSSSTTFKPFQTREKISSIACYVPIIPDSRIQTANRKSESSENAKKIKDKTENITKTIIDIANCDGPIKFTKILNTAYNIDKLRQQKTCIINVYKTGEFVTQTKDNTIKSSSRSSHKKISLKKCIYCNQQFKSNYCLQKHIMRHINNVDASKISGLNAQEQNHGLIKKRSRHCKRSVKPLDMNVQYYPCKTCGVKFPSYYFVHKHRKLCHSDEEN